MEYKLQDLIDVEQFQRLQDRLNEIYAFPSAIIDNEGHIFTATAWQDICTQFHRKNKECEKECIKSDQYILSHLGEADPAVSYRCPHGLIDNAAPIIIEGVHYGNFFTGQFFLEKPDLEFFRKQAKRYGFDEEAYLEAVKKVPVWTQEQLNSYLFFIKGLIEVISGIGLKNLKEIETTKQLKKSEEKYRTLVEVASQPIFTMNREGVFLFMNTVGAAQMGGKPEDFIGKTMWDLFPADLANLQMDNIAKAIDTGKLVESSRETIVLGKKLWFGARIQPLQNEEGENDKVLVILTDITERKRAEEARRQSEERANTILHQMPDGFFAVNPQGHFVEVNESGCRMLGYTRNELLQMSVADIEAKEQPGDIADRIKSMMRKGSDRFESHHRCKDGRSIDVDISVTYLPDHNLFIGFHRDITERKKAEEERHRLEERLSRAEKMESIGTLAGGVAHDLNNVLGILVGYSELLLIELPEASPLRRHVSNILQSGQRAAAIIQDLLTLARRGVAISEVVNLNDVISGHLKTLEFEKLKAYHPRVTFTSNLEKDLLNIKGSPIHLEKAVMNLLSNAAEAISPDRGEVTMVTENRYIDKPVTGYDHIQEGDYVVFRVSDNGKGITSEDLRKIFEPFYTKKVMGRSGTGLGLAVVWGTVKDHGGYIDVQSEEGKGSTFTLYLPVTREDKENDQKVVSPESYIGRGETILVVDDVKEQRELATTMLGNLGYRVSVVSSGEEAVAYLKTDKADLVMLDMIMDPGMDGLDTYQKILEINPKQKAIIVSGFSETDRVKKAEELGVGAYVKKPYMREKMGLVIRRELDRT